MTIEPSIRRRQMAAMTLAPLESLADGLRRICPQPAYDLLRPPETGLVMVQGRIGNTGRAFNLGEMLVTRCTVRYLDRLGHGWVPGRMARQAELAALGDALGQIPDYSPALDLLVEKLESAKRLKDAAEQEEIRNTQVQFFTLVRGEDGHD